MNADWTSGAAWFCEQHAPENRLCVGPPHLGSLTLYLKWLDTVYEGCCEQKSPGCLEESHSLSPGAGMTAEYRMMSTQVGAAEVLGGLLLEFGIIHAQAAACSSFRRGFDCNTVEQAFEVAYPVGSDEVFDHAERPGVGI